jgi:large subunit ribosomal protein L18
MIDKNPARLRRARQTRLKIREIGAVRLTVHRTNGHIYAQITSSSGDKVLASASSLEKDLRAKLKTGGNKGAAEAVGQRIAEKAKAAGVERVAFDRAGFAYHGRVKALAEAAREAGLQF